ncbi:adenylyl-sulfate kinase [Paenibacillus sediminis]|uniref:Adenylylsulfate kinase n=1 Tax=Paenibacillus sediminis TaxID=664909 RepID=A0ABS4GYI7_9BACL|nr:adenylyl-sulfate kinase [Paenibacillus sediminis]MBP1935172.1 adenylylsulfate kinase [Paenibacillus sediminis]
MQNGAVIWFTGLPNSGKSTISRMVAGRLEAGGARIERLDSDEVPPSLTKELSPDWTTRQKQKCINLLYIAQLLARHHVNVLIASVGRLEEMRTLAHKTIDNFVEVHLDCPLEVRLARDEKAKYLRHSHTIHYYERSNEADLLLSTNILTPDQCTEQIIHYLIDRKMIAFDKNSGDHS